MSRPLELLRNSDHPGGVVRTRDIAIVVVGAAIVTVVVQLFAGFPVMVSTCPPAAGVHSGCSAAGEPAWWAGIAADVVALGVALRLLDRLPGAIVVASACASAILCLVAALGLSLGSGATGVLGSIAFLAAIAFSMGGTGWVALIAPIALAALVPSRRDFFAGRSAVSKSSSAEGKVRERARG